MCMMELPLAHVPNCEQGSVIMFFNSEADIHWELMRVYGMNTMSVHVRNRVHDFLNGSDEVHNLSRVGHPSTAWTGNVITSVCSILEDNQHYTVQQLDYCKHTELCNDKIS